MERFRRQHARHDGEADMPEAAERLLQPEPVGRRVERGRSLGHDADGTPWCGPLMPGAATTTDDDGWLVLPAGTLLQLRCVRERMSRLPPGRFIEVGTGAGELS